MHRRKLVAAIVIFAALFVVADGNLPARNRAQPCGIMLIGAALPRRTPAGSARAAALEPPCEGIQLEQGFTLIELSIVLVIIGLIVGGVLVGADMISAAALRATIAQIEKYNSAVNTFRTKYNELPGDMDAASAAQFGFVARAGMRGRGDNNGLLEGYYYAGSTFYGWNQNGENVFFWEDLSSAGLIDGQFNTATDATYSGNITSSSSPPLSAFLPAAKLGGGNYFVVYSFGSPINATTGINYFALLVPTIAANSNLTATPGLSVSQAYNIDKKVDDGLPLSGKITTNFISGGATSPPIVTSPNTTTSGGNSSSCYDTTTNTYSMGQNNGANVNCALSFQMQGAAR